MARWPSGKKREGRQRGKRTESRRPQGNPEPSQTRPGHPRRATPNRFAKRWRGPRALAAVPAAVPPFLCCAVPQPANTGGSAALARAAVPAGSVCFAGPLPPRRGAEQGKTGPMKATRHPFPAKLTLEQAEVIRKRYAAGESPAQLASEFGVAPSSVYAVVHERAHRRRVVVTLSSDDFRQQAPRGREARQPRGHRARAHPPRARDPLVTFTPTPRSAWQLSACAHQSALAHTVQSTPTLSSADLIATKDDPPEMHIRRYLRFRGTKPGEIIALEAIEPSTQKHKYSPFMLALTSDPKEVEKLAMKSDNDLEPKGCFIQQNEVKAAVAAKQAHDEWLAVKRDQGLKGTSIATRRAFYLDFDPVREDGISSTSEEQRLAFERADRAALLLAELLGDGSARSVTAAPGTAAHIHIALDSLPNDDETEGLVHACLDAADRILSDDFVKVDTLVHDARRIGAIVASAGQEEGRALRATGRAAKRVAPSPHYRIYLP